MNQAGGYDAMTIVKEKNEAAQKHAGSGSIASAFVRQIRPIRPRGRPAGRVIMEPGDKAHACQGQIFHF